MNNLLSVNINDLFALFSRGLRCYLQPASWTILDIGIITIRILAIVPITGLRLNWLSLLLYIDWRRGRHDYRWGVIISAGIV